MKILPGSNSGFTLIELIISAVIAVIVFMGVLNTSTFTCRQITLYVERYNMYSQIDLALQDMQARLPAAVEIAANSLLDSSDPDDSKTHFTFQGESDIFRITPDNLADNARYTYEIDPANNLILRKEVNGNVVTTVLVEGKFLPAVSFGWDEEPNFLKITLTARSPRKQLSGLTQQIAKVEGIRLWFINAVE